MPDNVPISRVFELILRNWRILLIGAAAGCLVSVGATWKMHPLYEARMTVGLAMIVDPDGGPYEAPLQDPIVVYDRLKRPLSYSKPLLLACGVEDTPQARGAFTSRLQLKIPLMQGRLIHVHVRGPDPQSADNCAKGLFDEIREYQAGIIRSAVLRHESIIARVTERCDAMKRDVVGSGRGVSQDLRYAIWRDELLLCLKKVETERSKTGRYQSASLIGPISVLPNPVFPSRTVLIIVGIVLGAGLGGLTVLLKQRSDSR